MDSKQLIGLTQNLLSARRDIENNKSSGFFVRWYLRKALKKNEHAIVDFVKGAASAQASLIRKQTIGLYNDILAANDIIIEIN